MTTPGFNNPILGGDVLLRDAIQSTNYTAGASGWSINKDGTAEFNGVTIRGTVVLGSGTTDTIILDNTRDALFVYDAGGKLTASISPNGGVDSFGNIYQAGVVSYLSGDVAVFSQLLSGNLFLATGDAGGQPFQIFTSGAIGGPHGDQPYSVFVSPADAGVPTPITAQLEMFGEDPAQVRQPLVRVRQAGIIADMDMLIQGELKYSAPGALNWGEVWHAFAFSANWANLGAPWSNAAYRKSNGGTVELSGSIQWTDGVAAAPVQITTLPAGYRPAAQKHLITSTMPGPAATPQIETIEVRTDGTMWLTNYPAGGPNTPITLEGLWFPLGN